MVSAQVELSPETMEKLRAVAAGEGVSVEDFIRQAVDAALADADGPTREELRERASKAIGCFHSGTGDLSRRHDEYFAEAVLGG